MNFKKFALKNILGEKENYIGYWISCVITVFIFFVFSMNKYHPELNAGPGAVASIMSFAQVAIIIFSIFFLSLSINSFLIEKQKNYGVLLMMGMSKRQLIKLIIYENLVIGISGTIVGILLGMIFGHLLIMLMAKIINVVDISFYFPIESIVITLVLFFILFLLLSIINSRAISKKSVYNLVNIEKNEYKNFKSSKVLSLLSLLLMAIGYLFANLTKINELIKSDFLLRLHESGYLEFLISAFVTVGMFLYFTQFLKYFVDKLRSNKKYYFNFTNALWISELKYRLLSNSLTMFVSALLISIAFVIINGTIALNTTVTDEVSKEVPFDLSYYSYLPNDKELEDISFIEETLDADSLEYEKNKIDILKGSLSSGSEDINEDYLFVRESDYNKMSASQLKLKDSEIALVSEKTELLNKKLNLFKEYELVVTELVPNIFESYIFQNLIVLNDTNYNKAEAKYTNFINAYIFNYTKNPSEDEMTRVGGIIRDSLGNGRSDGNSFLLVSKIERINVEKYTYQVFTYIGIMLSIVLIIASGSVIYFRLIRNINASSSTYYNLNKIGLNIEEIQKIQIKQFRLMYFIPVIMALINTLFAINLLSYMLRTNIWIISGKIALIMILIQIIIYLYMRSKIREKIEYQLNQMI